MYLDVHVSMGMIMLPCSMKYTYCKMLGKCFHAECILILNKVHYWNEMQIVHWPISIQASVKAGIKGSLRKLICMYVMQI